MSKNEIKTQVIYLKRWRPHVQLFLI